MKRTILSAAAALALLATPALANQCYMVADFINPDFLRCKASGQQDGFGRTIWICCN